MTASRSNPIKVFSKEQVERELFDSPFEDIRHQQPYWKKVKPYDIIGVREYVYRSGVTFTLASPSNGLVLSTTQDGDKVRNQLFLNEQYGILFIPYSGSYTPAEMLSFEDIQRRKTRYNDIRLDRLSDPVFKIIGNLDMTKNLIVYLFGKNAVLKDSRNLCDKKMYKKERLGANPEKVAETLFSLMKQIVTNPPKIKQPSKKLKGITDRLRRKRSDKN